jgi:hypothetical protein
VTRARRARAQRLHPALADGLLAGSLAAMAVVGLPLGSARPRPV